MALGFGNEVKGADVVLCYYKDRMNGKVDDAHVVRRNKRPRLDTDDGGTNDIQLLSFKMDKDALLCRFETLKPKIN